MADTGLTAGLAELAGLERRVPMPRYLQGRSRDWSRAELAQRLEVSRQSGNAIETGKFDPSLTLAFKLSAAVRDADRGDLQR